MSYPLHTYAIIGYIESHISEGKLNYTELERQIGFSYAHIRDFFKKNTGVSLGQYIRRRQLYASAFELLHTDKSVMELALTYGFSNHESFTPSKKMFRNCILFKRATTYAKEAMTKCLFLV